MRLIIKPDMSTGLLTIRKNITHQMTFPRPSVVDIHTDDLIPICVVIRKRVYHEKV